MLALIALPRLLRFIHDLPDFISEIPIRRLIFFSVYFLVAGLLIRQIYAYIKKTGLGDLEELNIKINSRKVRTQLVFFNQVGIYTASAFAELVTAGLALGDGSFPFRNRFG